MSLVWACTTPTEMCGCPPSLATLTIAGTLRNSLGAPVPNLSFAFEATADAVPTFTFIATDARTDANGAFVVKAQSGAAGAHSLVARIIRVPQNDTLRIAAGSATFKGRGQKPDTLHVTLRQL